MKKIEKQNPIEQLPTDYRSEGVVEVRPSGIEGLGVFALRSFRAGDRIRQVNVVREVTPDAPIREELGERSDHCNYPDGKVVLYGPPDRHLNHSCEPNAYEIFEEGATFLVALKDIAAGTEITCDYNINIANGTAWPCRCGSTRCLGMVVGDFFLLPKQRQWEYRPLLAGWFVNQHRERIEILDREFGDSEVKNAGFSKYRLATDSDMEMAAAVNHSDD